ncbi:MAG: prolyl oligopeptidase family serine peptidase [Tepidisphaerales bacterium]
MKSLIQAGLIVTALAAGVSAADAPPVAPIRVVVDDYHGTKIADPYRYMENLADPEVQMWIKGQAEYAQRVLKAIPARDRLLDRIRELDAGAPYRISILRRWPNGDLHYLKTLASENLDKLYFKDAKTGQERLLVDPEKMAEGGRHYALDFCTPSPDGRYVAYGVAAAGSEQTVLHILDTTTGKDLPDVIDRMEADYTHPCWLPDASGFVYSRRRQLPADAPPTEGYKQTRAYLHKLGGDPAKDRLVFAMNTSPAVPMAEVDFPSIVLTSGSRFAIGKIKHGDANELTLYAAPTSTLEEKQILWKKICDAKDEVEEFAVNGDDVYLLTAAGAPRYRAVRIPLDAPDFAGARSVVPAGEAVITGIAAARDALYVALLDNGVAKVGRVAFEPGGKLEMIALPPEASDGHPMAVNTDVDGALVATASWTRGGRIYAYDPKTRALADTNLRPRGKYDDVEGYESAEVLVPSHDGVKVPLSILYKKGIKLDGSHPALVSGYGGYGMRSSAYFNPVRLAWLERGGVLGIAHVRGGGEYGKEWHMAGRQQTKPNTWKDFIACCEYLVQKGYTSTPKLAGLGGSAGGILIGRAITERPDLYAAAIIEVGCLDMLRFETTTNGVPNIPELGSTRTKEGFESLLRMSSYHQVKDGTKYPAVLLTHGINDPRVEPWMSAKMTARLQAATGSRKPVLFRVDYDAGHGIGSTKKQRQEQTADIWAFLLWQMGEEGFQR